MKKLAENFLNLNKIIIAILFITVGFFIGKHASAANTDFTIGVWVKGATTTASRAIAVKNNEIRLATDSAGRPVCQFHNGTAWRPAATSTDALDAGKWYYVACSYSGSAVKVYINGTEKASISDTASVNNTANVLRIGNDAGGTYSDWVGFIDEVKIYPYARSAQEIRADYAAGLAGVGTSQGVSAAFGSKSDSWMSDGLVGYWKMDESATTSGAIDSSGNGLHGTYIGDASTTAGKFGNGGVFDGSGDYTEIANDTSLNYNEGTISGWFKLDNEFNGTSPTSQIIMERYYDNNNHFIVVLSGTDYNDGRGIPDGALIFKVEKAPYNIYGYRYVWTKNTSWDAGVWYHFAVMSKKANGENNKVYINGADDTAGNVGENGPEVDYNSSIRIGGSRSDTAQLSGERYFDGVIDEVRIYNRILSSQEARLLYEWAPGPVAHWKFDEHVSGDGKTVYDSAASSSFSGGNHGTTNDGANNTGMDCSRPGKYGTSCEFDGADDYINAGSKPTVDDIRQMTVTAWIYPETLGEGNSGIILCKGANWGTDGQWAFFLGGNYRIRFMKYFTSNDIYVSSANNSITLNQWQHVALTWTGGGDASEDVSIYVNGNEVSYISQDDATGYKSDAAHNVYIGNSVNSAATFDGLIDDVRIYNYARTQKQILEDMHGGKPGPHPVLHLSFDEGYGGTAYDSSGYGNNGTLFPGTGGTNTATSAMWTMDGKFGKAVEFDGTDDYVSFSSPDGIDDASTIAVWVYPDTLAQNGVIVSIDGTSFDCAFGIYNDGDKILLDTPGNDLGLNDVSAYLTAQTWQHWVVIYESGSVSKFFLDGEEKTMATVLDRYDVIGTQIGSRANGTQRLFDGLIDEVKIYNYALTEEEIKREYASGGKSAVMGSTGTATTTSPTTGETIHVPSFAALAQYCVPGSTDYCAAPVGEWKFDEKTGTTTYDTSGYGDHAAIYGPSWTRGKFGSALEFGGGSDYARTFQEHYGRNYIFSFWIKPTDFGEEEEGTIFESYPYYSFFIKILDSKKLYYIDVSLTTAGEWSSPENSFRLNEWSHITVIGNNSNPQFYVNGIKLATITEVSPSGPPRPVAPDGGHYIIGNNSAYDKGFKGLLDHVRIYDYVRTPAQIAWEYNKGKPIAEWRFDECQGSTIHDESGNGNHGQLFLGSSGVTATGTCASSSNSFWYNGRDGKVNSAGSFDGEDDYVSIADSSLLRPENGEWSASLWAKIADYEQLCSLIGKWQSSSPWEQWNMYISDSFGGSSGRRLVAGLQESSGSISRLSMTSDPVIDGTWHHMLFVSDKNTDETIIYIDGKRVSYSISNYGVWPTVNNSDPVLINGNGSNYCEGLIDDVKIWNYALTAEQVKMEYSGGAVKFGQ